MSWLDNKQKDIKQQYVGATGKRVLLVEGPDDVHAFSAWLGKIDASWENRWAVAEAGKKASVLGLLTREPNWVGVVDRDEWSAEVIADKQQALPNLWVLPRFCLENYLCDPAELWAMLPEVQKLKIQGGEQALHAAITENLPMWRQHGALWHVINPLWEGLRALGFKERLLDIQLADDENAIRQTLNEWHQYLSPEQIWTNYQTCLAEMAVWPEPMQLQCAVHGKHFFPNVVHSELSRLLGEHAKASQRQNLLLQSAPPPADLAPLWQKMGLQH
ncbi:DUF4435 domain-containing protein [Plesiomonas sp. PI-19]|uniref:DUF4435 domain-containing protein n=1 Tax=Plesiomonas sp. PI-19 TaxID=2898798 RepID=UPI001F1CAABD|nr:DUF4435 domain-containing protein [Plesiomonas sp. PI-19]MCE5164301.1 DUF4435 domain-containing protein [Plesiomonas sp. PI-19]